MGLLADAFYKQGVGDCLLTYENEVIVTNWMLGRSPRTASKVLPHVVPANNVVVENPIALVDSVVDSRGAEVREAAEAFIRCGAASELRNRGTHPTKTAVGARERRARPPPCQKCRRQGRREIGAPGRRQTGHASAG